MKLRTLYQNQSAWRQSVTGVAIVLLSALFIWKGVEGLWDTASVELSFQRQRVFGAWAPALAKVNIALQLITGTLLGLGLTSPAAAGEIPLPDGIITF